MVAVEDAIEAELTCGMHRQLVAELIELSGAHPFRERFTALLMCALHRSGRAAEALSTYAAAERRMRSRLAIGPSADLQSLHARILRAEPI